MTFLPIVERELRVATRRRSTYWLRVLAAGVALIIGSGMLILTLIPFAGPMPGSAMFGTLTWMSLAASLSAGLFFTSDCLSEEKREGTLGFLFLTDLRGYDVVFGKLLATSLRSVSPLLAIFPILATTLLIGGVEVAHFWRSMLAIANAAFFSLSVGLFVSSLSRHWLKALAGTLVLLLLFIAFGPIVDELWSFVNGKFSPKLSLASPAYAFVSADYDRNFWPALTTSHVVAWVLLALACFLVRRTWQEKPTVRRAKLFSPGASITITPVRTRQRDAQLRAKNPVAWLAGREPGHALLLWILAAVIVGGFLILILTGAPLAFWHVWSWISSVLSLVLYLWVAAKACQFFAEARRSGALELLLATPLTSRETVQGAWQGLLRLFALPVLLLLGAQLVGAAVISSPTMTSRAELDWAGITTAIIQAPTVLINLIALGWFGLWMGLTSKNALTATLKTIAFVYIIPWLVIYFLVGIGMPVLLAISSFSNGSGGPAQSVMSFWLPLWWTGLPLVLTIIKDIVFWTIARKRLFGNFRQLAVRSLVPIHGPLLPPVIRPLR